MTGHYMHYMALLALHTHHDANAGAFRLLPFLLPPEPLVWVHLESSALGIYQYALKLTRAHSLVLECLCSCTVTVVAFSFACQLEAYQCTPAPPSMGASPGRLSAYWQTSDSACLHMRCP
jgi:hypothetical protein